MRGESVATLRVRNLAPGLGLRGVVVKGGKTRDIPLQLKPHDLRHGVARGP